MPKDFSPLSMEAPAVRFDYLKNSFEFSFLLVKSQLQILLKCLKTDRVFYILFLPLEFLLFNVMMFRLKAESTHSCPIHPHCNDPLKANSVRSIRTDR